MGNWAIIIALIGVVVGPLITYLIAAKRLSGRVSTSAAAELWEESRSIRQDLTKRNEYLRKLVDGCDERIEKLENRIDTLEAEKYQLNLENGALKQVVEEQKKVIAELKIQVTNLTDTNEVLKRENFLLHQRLDRMEGGKNE